MKHRNTIRLSTLLAALVLCLGLLAGCGSASQPDDAAEETSQAPAAPEGGAPESTVGVLGIILPAAGLAGCAVSVPLSLSFYNKREF